MVIHNNGSSTKVFWLTGLPAAGKTTIALSLIQELKNRGEKVEHLDGDQIRSLLPHLDFSKSARDNLIQFMGILASILERNGIHVVASFVSPYRESRQFVRALCKNFIEIYVSTPLEVCESRDPKKLYAKSRKGEINNLTGVNDPYEPPRNPEITFDTTSISADTAALKIVETFLERNNQ